MTLQKAEITSPRYFPIGSSLLRFVFMGVTLVLALLVVDFFANGPVATWFVEVTVHQPVQKRYGFTAEWRDFAKEGRLVVTAVTRNGRFDRAGIRTGFAFRPADCANFYIAGGHLWLLSQDPVAVRMETVPGDRTSARLFRLKAAL